MERWFDPSAPLNQDLRYDHGEGCCLRGETPDRRGRLYVRRIFSRRHGCYGWLYHCFNCGWSGFKLQDKSILSPPFSSAAPEERNYDLPDDCTFNFPAEVSTFLRAYNITDDLAHIHHVQWSPSMARVILPIYMYGEYVGYQARRIYPTTDPKKDPKYITVKKPGQVWWESGVDESIFYVVVVEDIFSGIVVSQRYPTVAVLGTKFPPELVNRLWHTQVIIWFDPDETGLMKAFQFLNELYYMPHGVRLVSGHDKDPKFYSVDEIKQYVEAARR